MDLGLAGRTALVTGGSKGIGLAVAGALVAEGASVVLAARSADALDRAAASLHPLDGATVRTAVADLADERAQSELVDAAGPVDILVNNAGAVPPGSLTKVDSDTWRAAWDLKVFGYLNLCRLVLPRLEAQGGGVIVNVIGAAGIRPQPSYVAGGVGNAALMALTTALGSRSLRKGVRVVGVNPGLVLTDRMVVLLQAQARAKWGDEGRWQELVPTDPAPATVEQVADVVTFLASARASHVSGCVVPVDAGESAR